MDLEDRLRARDLGVIVGEHPTGPNNAITDVAGVRVGHATLDEPGSPGVHTGVTVVVPHDDIWNEPVFAGAHRLNGSGELTGLEWIRESGELTSAIGLTNTHSVGVVRDALVSAQVRARGEGLYWSLPVVGETYDGLLNDINGHHVRAEHVRSALASARGGRVAEGNVGGGTGMICHGFKGGIGTSSRVTDTATGRYTVGVLVQANHGRRERLRVNGAPVGQRIGPEVVPLPEVSPRYEQGSGSIIVIVATDAPLLPHQCTRLAQRSALAVSRLGGSGEQYSGDLMLAFATGNRGIPPYAWDEDPRTAAPEVPLRMVAPQLMTRLFDLTIEATEEAIVNVLTAATTLTGRNGLTAHALDHDLFRQALADATPHQFPQPQETR
jgi:D-aminopeptidase